MKPSAPDQDSRTEKTLLGARAYHHGDLRPALIRAARAILETQGLDALSLRAMARRAGVSQTAPYHHFPDKAHLLAAVAAEGFTELAEAMNRRREQEQDPTARLVAAGLGYVAFATGNPALFRLMFGGIGMDFAADPALARAAQEACAVLTRSTREATAPPGANPEAAPEDGPGEAGVASLAAWSLVHGLAKLILEAGITPAAYGAADAADAAGAAGAEALAKRVLTHIDIK